MDTDLWPSFCHVSAVGLFHIKQMILEHMAEEEGAIECHMIEKNIFL